MGTHNLDSIHIRKLSLPCPVLAPNVWGDVKAQPAFVSVELHLRSGFDSAAEGDRLDNSTVHYGLLAKQIRAICREGISVEQLLEKSIETVETLAHGVLARCRLLIELPKGSMLGEKVEVAECRTYEADTKVERSLGFAGVRVPVLIGINAYERRMKQPLVIDLTVNTSLRPVLTELFGLEGQLVETIENTTFETLETLVGFTVMQLRAKTLDRLLPGGHVTLRIQKPMAISFADAPVIEVSRHIPAATTLAADTGSGEATGLPENRSSVLKLDVKRPYRDYGA